MKIIGVDASNLSRGGGVTHLGELLANAEPQNHNIGKVVVWGSLQLLGKLPDRPWLAKVTFPALNRGLFSRTCWQYFCLDRACREAGCDVLFAPGGSCVGGFRPIVTMSRNLLPFEWHELRRYGVSRATVRLLLLRLVQSNSYRKANGLIFLTEYARGVVQGVVDGLPTNTVTIPHGLNSRFFIAPKEQRPISAYSESSPYRLLYVSIVDKYKHQWHLVEAVHTLRAEGFAIVLDLVGPENPTAVSRLEAAIDRWDPDRRWIKCHGAVPYEILHEIYASADLGVFASSCENMPNILLETMASGLPIACSNRGPMPEVLGDYGVYFDPEDHIDMAQAIRGLMLSPQSRLAKATGSFSRAREFSWARCADETLAFLTYF